MIYGVLMIGCGNGLITWAVQFVPTGITALLGSAVPIIVVVINHLTGSAEKVNRKVAFGIVLGFIGPVIIFSDHLHEFLNLKYALGILFILLGGIAWSWGSILSKEYNLPYNSMMNAGFQMLFGGGAMLIGSLLIEKPSFAHADLRSLISLAYLVLVASAFAFTIYHFAMKHLPVTIVSLYTYVNPLVAIVLGWMFLGERLTWNILVAFVVIVAGIYLVNIGFQRNPKSVITRYLRKQR
jgi:drug/metabolite transporter (DMT)-like permease